MQLFSVILKALCYCSRFPRRMMRAVTMSVSLKRSVGSLFRRPAVSAALRPYHEIKSQLAEEKPIKKLMVANRGLLVIRKYFSYHWHANHFVSMPRQDMAMFVKIQCLVSARSKAITLKINIRWQCAFCCSPEHDNCRIIDYLCCNNALFYNSYHTRIRRSK